MLAWVLVCALVCAVMLAGVAVDAAAQSQSGHADRITVDGAVQAAKITTNVQPIYPAAAKEAGIAGTVVLHAVIGKDGSVNELAYVSGPEELVDAAMFAVRRWHYQPTLVEGQPVEVDTTISVVYAMGAGESGAAAAKGGDAAGQATNRATGEGQDQTQGKAQGGFTVQGGDHPFNRPTRIDPQLRADIEELLRVSHFDQTVTETLTSELEPLRAKMNAALVNQPNAQAIMKEYFDRVIAIGRSVEMNDSMILIYAKYWNDEQVKKALEFYKTEAGQQILGTQMKIFEDSRKAGDRIFTQNVGEILQDMCREHTELQGKIPACK
jgi:TonB family protein